MEQLVLRALHYRSRSIKLVEEIDIDTKQSNHFQQVGRRPLTEHITLGATDGATKGKITERAAVVHDDSRIDARCLGRIAKLEYFIAVFDRQATERQALHAFDDLGFGERI